MRFRVPEIQDLIILSDIISAAEEGSSSRYSHLRNLKKIMRFLGHVDAKKLDLLEI
jgi:hypothetical protein